jgi:hypothetical protein
VLDAKTKKKAQQSMKPINPVGKSSVAVSTMLSCRCGCGCGRTCELMDGALARAHNAKGKAALEGELGEQLKVYESNQCRDKKRTPGKGTWNSKKPAFLTSRCIIQLIRLNSI